MTQSQPGLNCPGWLFLWSLTALAAARSKTTLKDFRPLCSLTSRIAPEISKIDFLVTVSGGFAKQTSNPVKVVIRSKVDDDLSGVAGFQFDLNFQPQHIAQLLFERIDV